MEISINNHVRDVEDPCSVSALLQLIDQQPDGVAVAVNDTVVPRSQWQSFALKENDNILVIKATRGG